MHVLVTGANGFVGKALVRRLLRLPGGAAPGLAVDRLSVADLGFDTLPRDARLHALHGSIADPVFLETAFAHPVDCLFHLASIPGGAAEAHFELAQAVNLQATISLFERARRQGNRPVVVFASTIGVYSSPWPAVVDDDTPVGCPDWTYGAQKLIGEILLHDYSRKGFIDGRAVRLPGIVARPPAPSGALSIFLSDIIRELASGREFVCPMSPEARSWLMSVECCIDNLLNAATIPAARITDRRAWTLPALRVSMQELVEGVAQLHGAEVRSRVTYRPDPALEERFGRYPELRLPASAALGFRHDGSVTDLVRRALPAT
jgi:nucleoside-diphosphate-sugar epimerase